MQSFWAAKPQP